MTAESVAKASRMKLNDFDFFLPADLIATRPAKPRSSARLLIAQGDSIHDASVTDLVAWLQPGDLLVLNDTRVIPARLNGFRYRKGDKEITKAKIEVTLLQLEPDGTWSALIKPLKRINAGETLVFSERLSATLTAKSRGQGFFSFNLQGDDFDVALGEVGAMPLPPYIAAKRPADLQDKEDYQTVWARNNGAVAAPTASLHFDDLLLTALKKRGVLFTYVTLHVGAGTFLPVKVDDVKSHKMHAEWGQVNQTAAAKIAQTKAQGGRVIPVGTTSLRLIETMARESGLAPWEGYTEIFIYPSFQFIVSDGLITNFHLPKSTLMMLVSALMGSDRIISIYKHAVEKKYRFFSYGDASLLLPSYKISKPT